MVDVETTRRKLLEALGMGAEKYWSNMKSWYKQKITKDEFDTQAFEILGPGKIKYHNEFILSILAKCHGVATLPTSIKSKNSSKQNHSNNRTKVKRTDCGVTTTGFQAVDPTDSISIISSKGADQDVALCVQELVVPDVATLHGRLFLGAWDHGLDSIADDTAPLLVAAVEAQLKNILSLCVTRRKNSCVRNGTHFRYQYGVKNIATGLHNQQLYTSSKPKKARTYDQAEAEAHQRIAASDASQVLHPISLFLLRDTIQTYKHSIPSHTVRAGCLERTLATMCHPGHREIEQNKLYVEETKRLHCRLKQQRGLRV